jgi:uncharacterized protein involved in exopolysaccharide biosynthesis
VSAGHSSESVDLFDYALIRNVVGYVLRGVRRHKVLSAGVFVTTLVVGLGLSASWPRTFHAEARLLANQNQLIRALGNPRSSLPSEDPTRAAGEIIFAQPNLVSLIQQTNLMDHWDKNRPVLVRVRDALTQLVSKPITEQDKIDSMVGLLEKRLGVDTDQQTVTIRIDWEDAQMAYLLVETAQQNFLETRHVTEMSAISEALSILEVHASNVQKTVDETLRELERVREMRRKGGSNSNREQPTEGQTALLVGPAPTEPSPLAAPAASEQELAQLKFLLQSKKRALADLDDARARRVTELTAQLQEQRVQYADQHPIILDMQQRLQALQKDSPQIGALKMDIDALTHEYKRKGGDNPDSLVEPPRRAVPPRRISSGETTLSNAELSEDPMVEFARNNLRVAAAKYEELMMRVDGARIEQDTARAAFKYRYSVVRPASVPKKPIKPNVPLLVGLSFFLALALATVVGAALDWWRGVAVEAWQLERALGIKVLSQVKLP